MRVIVSIIVLLILVCLLILLINSTYTKETFISVKDIDEIRNYRGKVTDTYDTIDNPISDSLLPYNPKSKIEINEYEIIDLFKNILDRPPTIQEMKKFAYFTLNDLKEYLYNSPEYDKLIKTQDNHVNNGIEGAIAKRNLINRIMLMYSNIKTSELPTKMMMPLRDCFIHLQLNEYLFTAMLESLNYMKFQVDVLSTYVLTKKVLLELFNKHYNVLELKLIAQDKINRINDKLLDFSNDVENIKKVLVNITDTTVIDKLKSSFPNAFNEIIKSTISTDTTNVSTATNKTDIDQINEYLKKNIERFNGTGSGNENSNNNKNENENINKNENSNKNENENNNKNENNNINDKINKFLRENNYINEYVNIDKKKIAEKLTLEKKTTNNIDKLPDNTELYVRIYNPMERNNSYANIPDGYKPPVCTSLGQESLTQPVFTQSKLLFQGTDLNTAFNDSQVGSIMPKFIYKEYKDVKIN
jgi:hypothetical protein